MPDSEQVLLRSKKPPTALAEKECRQPHEYRSNPAFLQLLKSVYDGVAMCTLDGKILETNERLRVILGHHDEAAVHGLRIDELLSGADAELLHSINQALNANRYVLIQAYARHQSGIIFPVEISVNYLTLQQTYLCFFIRDISIRKKAEDLLRTGYNAINHCHSGIAVADQMGMVVYANPAAARIWDYDSEAELKGQSILNLWEDPAKAEAMITAIHDTSNEWNGDLVARSKDGRTTALHVVAARNLDIDDEVSGMVFSFVDISDRLRADAAIREAEARNAMLASLGAACHHLGQPATVLLTSLEMLKQQDTSNDPDTQMLLQSAHDAAIKLAKILKNLSRTREYRTTNYLENTKNDGSFNQILDIESAHETQH